MTNPGLTISQLTPLRWLLYAYALAGGGAETVAGLLAIQGTPQSSEAWDNYQKETAQAGEHPAMLRLCEVLNLEPFAFFCVKLALAAELLPAYRAVFDSMGGLTTALALRLYSSSPEEAAGYYTDWRRHERTARLLFSTSDTDTPLKLRPAVSGFLLGIGSEEGLEDDTGLSRLAMRVRTGYCWDDLILPERQKKLLRLVCDRSVYAETVYVKWGMDKGAAYGRGVRALFSGPPGTGKTMAAQIIARELEMEMYSVNISSLVSKYIGETEKNLETVFTEADKSGCILFFDEADALFGRRGEQKDSHDKYANMQTSFLLQRFESFGGMVLLASNLTSNLDPAFLRRIQIRIEFPAPDRALRLKIWENQLTRCAAPLSPGIDLPFLADKFDLTGSGIRGIALTAAFLAAAGEGVIGMRELLNALIIEYAKTDKILTARDLGEYGDALEIRT